MGGVFGSEVGDDIAESAARCSIGREDAVVGEDRLALTKMRQVERDPLVTYLAVVECILPAIAGERFGRLEQGRQ